MAGIKNTRQRAAISDALDRAAGFRTAQELYEDLRRADVKLGLATVYRTLQALADDDRVDVVRGEEGEALYRRCSTDAHHHHLVCRSCGFSVEIDNREVERWATTVARKHRFVDVHHDIEIFGRCNNCATSR